MVKEREAWCAAFHGVAKSWTWLSDWTTGHFQFAFERSESVSCSVVSWTVARLLCPWNTPGKRTGVGCHTLIQGIFPTQVMNPGLPLCRQILYHLRHLHVVMCIVNMQEGDLICRASENHLTMESFWYEIPVTLHQCFVGYYLNNVVVVSKYSTLHYRIMWLLQRIAPESDTSG